METQRKGKGRERERTHVDMPSEPDEAAYPIRSRSPRPSYPRGYSDDSPGDERGRSVRRPDQSIITTDPGENPFESKWDSTEQSLPDRTQGNPFDSAEGDKDEAYVDGGEDEDYGVASARTVEDLPETESNSHLEGTKEGSTNVAGR